MSINKKIGIAICAVIVTVFVAVGTWGYIVFLNGNNDGGSSIVAGGFTGNDPQDEPGTPDEPETPDDPETPDEPETPDQPFIDEPWTPFVDEPVNPGTPGAYDPATKPGTGR